MSTIPIAYQAFFLWIEPASTVAGTLLAWFMPETYLALSDPDGVTTTPSLLDGLFQTVASRPVPTGTYIALRQLGNMYLAFSLSEALVLRSTRDLNVWRAFLLVLLIADLGHLLACLPRGWEMYYNVATWNAIDWGNLAFVYCGASIRVCFLTGVGLAVPGKSVRSSTSKVQVKAKAKSNPNTDANASENARLGWQPRRPTAEDDTITLDSAEQSTVTPTPKAKRGRKKKI